MPDPLTAFGLASNVIQLVGFCAKLLSESHKFIKSTSDALPANDEIAQLAEAERVLALGITKTNATQLSPQEALLQQRAARCLREAACLLNLLNGLKVAIRPDGTKSRVEVLSKTLESRLKKSEIQASEERLRRLQDQVAAALLYLIRTEQAVEFQTLKACLKDEGASTAAVVLVARDKLLSAITPLVPAMEQRVHQLAAQGDQNTTTVIEELRQNQRESSRLTDETTKTVDGLATAMKELRATILKDSESKKARRIIDSLQFPEIRARQAAIDSAAYDTFKWIFRDQKTAFKSWLQSEDDLFWVTGKAGSGKSTLMKFLAEEKLTHSFLRCWAQPLELCFVEVYFWYAGTPIQKSEDGLLRTILYQILFKAPELVQSILPKRWDSSMAADAVWTRQELSQSLKAIAAWKDLPYEFCIFIDGLDEYQGDHLRLVCQLQELAACSNIKMCVSSRPWNVFNEAFGKLAGRIRLEELAKDDIQEYVTKELQQRATESGQVKALVRAIVRKAQGVFLWVYLVVRSVLHGFVEGDTVATLRGRVEVLPSDLFEYFKLILARIDPIYRNRTMQALKLATLIDDIPSYTAWNESFLSFWMLKQSNPSMDDSNFALKQSPVHLSNVELEAAFQDTQKALIAWTRDLLCLPRFCRPFIPVQKTDENPLDEKLSETPAPSHRNEDALSEGLARNLAVKDFIRQRVQPLHRTVFDFLRTEEVQNLLDCGVPDHFRDPQFLAHVQLAKLSIVPVEMPYLCQYYQAGAMPYLLQPSIREDRNLIDGFGALSLHYQQSFCCRDCKCLDYSDNNCVEILQTFVACGQRQYVEQVLKWKGGWSEYLAKILLHAACGWSDDFTFPLAEADPELIRMSLSAGADPNKCTVDSRDSPWRRFLTSWTESLTAGTIPDSRAMWQIAKYFIYYGADVEAEDTLRLLRMAIAELRSTKKVSATEIASLIADPVIESE